MFKRDVDYIVKEDKIELVDMFTGRILEGRSLSDGLHQAIEAKEGVALRMKINLKRKLLFKTISVCILSFLG